MSGTHNKDFGPLPDQEQAGPGGRQPSLKELLTAIRETKLALENKIDSMEVEINLLLTDVHKIAARVHTAEGVLQDQSEASRTLELEIQQLQDTTQCKELKMQS